ncbi:MAG: DUF3794 domain-containing protein, partial [Sphingobacteriia bacterium]|nr:DUF3794 domain-containing protein [Sphingobacteriia bacterium]
VSNKIIVKASVQIKTVYVSNIDKETCHEVENEIPFSQIIDIANAEDEKTTIDVSLQITGLTTEVAEDQNGENKIISCNLAVCAQVKAEKNMSLNILKDAFSINNSMKLDQKNINVEKVLDQSTNQVTIKDIMPVSPEHEDIGEIIDLSAQATIPSVVTDNQMIQVSGAVEIAVLCFAKDQYYTLHKQIPFQHQHKLPDASGKVKSEATVKITSVSFNINMSGEIELRILCDLHTKTMLMSKENIVGSANLSNSPASAVKRAPLVLYYPQKNDTLWEIAKRYGVKLSDIRKLNHLDENVQEINSMLMIPASVN